MSIVSVSPFWWPDPIGYGLLLGASSSFDLPLLMDAAAEKVAVIFQAPKAGNLARVGFRTGTVATGDTLRISFQTVDLATGDPDGTADQFRTQVVANADDNTWFRTSLVTSDGTDTGALRAVTKGELLAMVIEFNSFVAGNINIQAQTNVAARSPYGGRYYVDHFTAAWSKQIQAIAVMAIEYDDGSFAYIPNTLPFSTVTQSTVTTATNPAEVALRFTTNVPRRISGFWFRGSLAGDVDMVLYDPSDNVVATASCDKDVDAYGSGATITGYFGSSLELTVDSYYKLAFKPADASGGAVLSVSVPATPGAAQLDQATGGQSMHWSQRPSGGVWVNDTTRRPLAGLLIDGLDDGAGGGIPRSRFVNAGGL